VIPIVAVRQLYLVRFWYVGYGVGIVSSKKGEVVQILYVHFLLFSFVIHVPSTHKIL
jgi:hypothetical protein